VTRNVDFFSPKIEPNLRADERTCTLHPSPYLISGAQKPNFELNHLLRAKLSEHAGSDSIVEGLNATCDSFYATQGRQSKHFFDGNLDEHLQNFKDLGVLSIEMETFQLLHLGNVALPIDGCQMPSIATAAVSMVFADRSRNIFLTDENEKMRLQKIGGVACLETLIAYPIGNKDALSVDDPEYRRHA
jgi:hypothetical protein